MLAAISKTRLRPSSTLPLDAGLAEVLVNWRKVCPFNQDADYIFGSLDKNGQ